MAVAVSCAREGPRLGQVMTTTSSVRGGRESGPVVRGRPALSGCTKTQVVFGDVMIDRGVPVEGGAAARSFEAVPAPRVRRRGAGRSRPRGIGGWADARTTGLFLRRAQTGAKASSPRLRRVWCAQRVILRATERAARLPPARSRTWV